MAASWTTSWRASTSSSTSEPRGVAGRAPRRPLAPADPVEPAAARPSGPDPGVAATRARGVDRRAAGPRGHARPPSPAARLAALRIVHPFPSLLDGAVVLVVALLAGADVGRALVLGASMTLLQFAIGAGNDLVDAPLDRRAGRAKPIPAGLVRERSALLIVRATAAAGLLLALVAGGFWVAVLALAGLGIGAWYDLRARGTPLSWLPIALGIPLLPVFGWLGAAGSLPGELVAILPAAAVAGAGLAIANAIVDHERDRAAGTSSVVVALGPRRAAFVTVALAALVTLHAARVAADAGAPGGWVAAVVLAGLAPIAGACLTAWAELRGLHDLHELGWELQAVGTALLAVAWVAALSAVPGSI